MPDAYGGLAVALRLLLSVGLLALGPVSFLASLQIEEPAGLIEDDDPGSTVTLIKVQPEFAATSPVVPSFSPPPPQAGSAVIEPTAALPPVSLRLPPSRSPPTDPQRHSLVC